MVASNQFLKSVTTIVYFFFKFLVSVKMPIVRFIMFLYRHWDNGPGTRSDGQLSYIGLHR